MAQQTINIGTVANDGTGDTLRVGGDKINDNFTELYAADAALGTAAPLDIDTDDTLAANSDSLIPTQQAVKAYVDGSVGSSISELDDIPDVNAPTPANGDVLTWDSTPGEWVNAAPAGAGAFVLDDATDVNAPTPANGDVLTWDSTPGEWVPAAPSGGGDVTFLGRTAFSASTNVDIALPDAYDSFHIEFYLTAGTDNVALNAGLTGDNFATVLSGASDYIYNQFRHSNTTGASNTSAGSNINLVTTTIGNAANEFVQGAIEVINAKETAPTHVRFDGTYSTTTTTYGAARTLADYKPTTSINGIRLSASSGTVTGFYKVWARSA